MSVATSAPGVPAAKVGAVLRPAAAPVESVFRDRILLCLVNGMSVEAAEGYCLQQGMDLETARQIVAEARKRIAVAADCTREEQLGLAVRRLEDLYAKSINAKDPRTAFAVRTRGKATASAAPVMTAGAGESVSPRVYQAVPHGAGPECPPGVPACFSDSAWEGVICAFGGRFVSAVSPECLVGASGFEPPTSASRTQRSKPG